MAGSSYYPLSGEIAAPADAGKPIASRDGQEYRVSLNTHPPRYFRLYPHASTAPDALRELGIAIRGFAGRYFQDVEPFDIKREDGAVDDYHKHLRALQEEGADAAQIQAAGAQFAGMLVRHIATLAKSIIDDKERGRRPGADALQALKKYLPLLYETLPHVTRRDPQPLFHDTDEAIIEMASGVHKRTPNAKDVVEEEVGELTKAVVGVIASESKPTPKEKDEEIVARVHDLAEHRWKKIESAIDCFGRIETSMNTLLQTRPYLTGRRPALRSELQPLIADFMQWSRIRIGIRSDDVGAYEEATENFQASYLRLVNYRFPGLDDLSGERVVVGGQETDMQWEARRLMLDLKMGATLVKDMVFRRQNEEKGTAAFEHMVTHRTDREAKIAQGTEEAMARSSHQEAQRQRREAAPGARQLP